jgi:hypothetical protein
LAAGVDIFTLARRMGTSVKTIDRTYGHLVAALTSTSVSCWMRSTRPAPEPGRAVDPLEAEDAA